MNKNNLNLSINYLNNSDESQILKMKYLTLITKTRFLYGIILFGLLFIFIILLFISKNELLDINNKFYKLISKETDKNTLTLNYTRNDIDVRGNQTLFEQVLKKKEYNIEHEMIEYVKKWNFQFNSSRNRFQAYVNLLNDTHRLMVLEQILPAFNVTKRPVVLSNELDCSNKNYTFLTGKLSEHPANIIDVLVFGYELFLLEIRLYELYDVVDEFILFESNITFKQLPKPYFFKENKNRFDKFLDKITLISPFEITRFNRDGSIKNKIKIDEKDILDDFKKESKLLYDQNIENRYYNDEFSFEIKSRMVPINIYQKYIREFNSFDIFITGDIDEIPASNIINHFKYCQVHQNQFPFSAWSTMYMYSFSYLFRHENSVPVDPFSYRFPNIINLNDINKNNFTRLRPKHVIYSFKL